MSRVRHLADTNILAFLIDRKSIERSSVVGALLRLARLGSQVCVAPQNLIELWRICTRPLIHNGLGWTPAEADRELAYLETTMEILAEGPEIYPEWRRLVVAHSVSGVQVHDARLVAVMNVHRVESILTFNVRDFRRYHHLQIVHPDEV